MDEAVQHEADGGQGDRGFGDLGQFFVVFGQPPVSAKPAERSFNDSAPRENDETGPGDSAHDDQRQAEQEAGERDREPVINAIGEHRLEPAVQPLDPAQQASGAVGVLDVGGVDDDPEQEAGGIDRDVAFASPDLLGRVVAARPPFSVVLTLWVSIMAAVGLAWRPSCSRSMTTGDGASSPRRPRRGRRACSRTPLARAGGSAAAEGGATGSQCARRRTARPACAACPWCAADHPASAAGSTVRARGTDRR